MKLMAVGLQGRGKTTLISVLRNPSAPLPGNVSTVGVEVAEWTLSPPAHVLRTIKKNHPLHRVSWSSQLQDIVMGERRVLFPYAVGHVPIEFLYCSLSLKLSWVFVSSHLGQVSPVGCM